MLQMQAVVVGCSLLELLPAHQRLTAEVHIGRSDAHTGHPLHCKGCSAADLKVSGWQ